MTVVSEEKRRAAEAAARLRGAAEALDVLRNRRPQDRREVLHYAATLLAQWAGPADWRAAGFPVTPQTVAGSQPLVPVGHPSVLKLAIIATLLDGANRRLDERSRGWSCLTDFFAPHVAADDEQFGRLREYALSASADAGELTDSVLQELVSALEMHRRRDGEDAYLTGLARANLAEAYRQRGEGTDLADSAAVAAEVVRTRTERYGPGHPSTLMARSVHARSLLHQAETAQDEALRLGFAQRALAETTEVRAARDRLFGVTSLVAIRSRRYEGHALLLLGEPERARSCLAYVLAFETIHNGNSEWPGSGSTHLLLARAYEAVGDVPMALSHALDARRLLAQYAPAGSSLRGAQQLVDRLQCSGAD